MRLHLTPRFSILVFCILDKSCTTNLPCNLSLVIFSIFFLPDRTRFALNLSGKHNSVNILQTYFGVKRVLLKRVNIICLLIRSAAFKSTPSHPKEISKPLTYISLK